MVVFEFVMVLVVMMGVVEVAVWVVVAGDSRDDGGDGGGWR